MAHPPPPPLRRVRASTLLKIMLNMNKTYRAELRDLKRNRRKIERDLKKAYRDAQRAREQVIRTTILFLKRADKGAVKALTFIDRRIGILEGRLS